MRGLPSPAPLHFSTFRRACTPYVLLALCSVFSTFIFSGCATVSAGNSAASPAALSIVPAEVDFKSVVVGQKNSQTIQITNTSNKNIDLNSLRVAGASFSLLSAKAPVILTPGSNLSMNIAFAPTSTASESGALTIASPDLKNPVSVPLLGTGEKPAPSLQATPSTINFGSHALNSSAFQSVTLANTGNVPLTLNSVGISGPGYSITGVTSGVSLSPEQKLELQVWFHPTAAGNSVATLVASASALPSPLRLAVSGSASATSTSSTGSPAPTSSHSVALDWDPSASSVVGYHVYRGGAPGGPYSRITGSMVSTLNFKDADVQSGGRYFYVVTALGADGVESPFSNEVAADIPNP